MSAQQACVASGIPTGSVVRAEVEGVAGMVPVAVVRDEDGELHAVLDRCSHGAVPLSDGEVDGCTLVCALHGSAFNLRTGMPRTLPATQPVPVYPLTLDGDRVLVDVDMTLNS